MTSPTPDEPTPGDEGPNRPSWLVVAIAIAVGLAVAGIAVAALGNGDDEPVAATDQSSTSTTSSTTTGPEGPTTTLVFQAPPPQAPSSTDAPPPTEPATSAPTTTSPATTVPSSTTTTTPRRFLAKPGPTVTSTEGDHHDLAVAIGQAQARWDEQDLPRGYVFRTERVCFCAAARNDVIVDDRGVVVDQRNVSGEKEASPPTIDDLFTLLLDAADRNAHEIRVAFDEDFGYPVDLFIDYEENLADEEAGRRISWIEGR